MSNEQFMEGLSEAVTVAILEEYEAYYGNPLGTIRGAGHLTPGKRFEFKQTFTSGEHTIEVRVSCTRSPKGEQPCSL